MNSIDLLNKWIQTHDCHVPMYCIQKNWNKVLLGGPKWTQNASLGEKFFIKWNEEAIILRSRQKTETCTHFDFPLSFLLFLLLNFIRLITFLCFSFWYFLRCFLPVIVFFFFFLYWRMQFLKLVQSYASNAAIFNLF